MTYRKIGGLHWLAIGRLRIAFCIVKPRYTQGEIVGAVQQMVVSAHQKKEKRERLMTWTPWERNAVFFPEYDNGQE